jgi:hypothetical protein
MPESQPNPAELAIQVGAGYIASSSLNIAIELEIAERLAAGPRPVGELATEAQANEDALYRVLRLLASLGMFSEGPVRTFSNTDASAVLIAGAEGSVRDVVRWISDPFHFRAYVELLHSVRTGKPCFEKVFGMPIFEYFPTDPVESKVFNDAMTSFSTTVIPAALEAYDFADIETLVDVAGGHGEVLCSILAQFSQMRGVLCDLEHVVEGAGEVLRRHGVEHRVRLETCDFFKSVPAGGDAYIMKHIIHDWDDDRAGLILRNIREAMGTDRQGKKLLLIETVLAPGNEPHVGKLMDIEMLALPGGRERTEQEYRALFDSAGFRLSRIVETKSPFSVIEAVVG